VPDLNGDDDTDTAVVNNDGVMDLIVANLNDGTVSILYDQTPGGLELGLNLPVGESASTVVAADFNRVMVRMTLRRSRHRQRIPT